MIFAIANLLCIPAQKYTPRQQDAGFEETFYLD